jgi:hypothetical protein
MQTYCDSAARLIFVATKRNTDVDSGKLLRTQKQTTDLQREKQREREQETVRSQVKVKRNNKRQ